MFPWADASRRMILSSRYEKALASGFFNEGTSKLGYQMRKPRFGVQESLEQARHS